LKISLTLNRNFWKSNSGQNLNGFMFFVDSEEILVVVFWLQSEQKYNIIRNQFSTCF